MIFNEERYFLCGDQFLSVYYGNEGSLEENILAITIDQAIGRARTKGILESVATASSILIRYDPYVIEGSNLISQIKEITKAIRTRSEKVRIDSSVITIPMLYNDPWTQECAKAHHVPPNLEVIAKFNGLGSIEEVVIIHSSETYWVRYVAGPGLVGLITLSPKRVLLAPKYERPRSWTPSRTFGLGGHVTSYYPFEMPGGIQLLGRIPIPLFDATRRHPAFGESPAICNIGDRIKFIPITKEEYDENEKEFPKYEYRIERDIFEFELKGDKGV